MPASASYDEALEQCKAFAAANKTSPDPCECIAKNIGDNQALIDEQASLKTLADYDKASKELHAAVDPCLSQ
jgi:hypothetical protein